MRLLLLFFTLLFFTNCSGNFLTNLDRSRITTPVELIAPPFSIQLGNFRDDQWTTLQPASFNERCSAVVADPEGNIYCAGHTSSELFDTNSTNTDDIVVFKISLEGELLWATQIGENNTGVVSGGDTTLADICIGVAFYDDAVYCNGRTRGSLGAAGSGSNECLVAKFNAQSGNVEWIRQFASVSCNGVGVNATGVYLGGGTSANIGEAPGGSTDVLIIKLDHNGNDVWFRQLGAVTPVPGGDTAGNDFCRDLAVDNSNGVYCAGTTQGSLGEAYGGNTDVMMVKYDSDGNLLWVTQLGADSFGADASGSDLCWSIALTETGAFCGGRTTGSLGDVNTGGALGSNVDTLVVRLNANTGATEWVNQIGENSSEPIGSLVTSGSGVCDEIATDSNENVYCGGRTVGDLFDTNAGNNDAMTFKLDPSGSFVWGTQIGVNNATGDATQYDSVFGMTVSNGQVYLGGDTLGGLFETTAGSRDMFLFTVDVQEGFIQ